VLTCPIRSFIDEEEHLHADLVDTIPAAGRHDLTDEQWTILESLLPVGKNQGRPPTWTRQLIDGIRWRTRAGVPWRDVPAQYGTWQSDGTWAWVLTGLQARADAAGARAAA
jgi:transposase